MQGEVLQSRALTMIAEMASGAGHELNNPLTIIAGRAEILASDCDDENDRKALATIRDKAHEASEIVSALMEFAKPRVPQYEEFDLLVLLHDCRNAALENRNDAVKIEILCLRAESLRQPGENMPRYLVRADRTMLQRVFDELLQNALEHVPAENGAVQIEIEPAATRDAMEIRVRDNGCGMQAKVLERAFDPFFSYRPAGRSRGLGLAYVHRIIETHHGKVWLDSQPEKGTTVHIVLPRSGTPLPGAETFLGE